MAPPTPPKWLAASQAEVAFFFGIGSNTLKTDWKAVGCPLIPYDDGETRGYDLAAITQWRIQHERKKKPRSEDEMLLESADQDWKDRWIRGKALLTEEELGKVQGRLVSIEEVSPLLRRLAEMLADGIRRLETEHGRDAADIMRTPIERLSEELEGMSDSDATSHD